jgi:hypothetical protein
LAAAKDLAVHDPAAKQAAAKKPSRAAVADPVGIAAYSVSATSSSAQSAD